MTRFQFQKFSCIYLVPGMNIYFYTFKHTRFSVGVYAADIFAALTNELFSSYNKFQLLDCCHMMGMYDHLDA